MERIDLFTNGHMAIELTLQAMGLGQDGRNEVITTPFTFASTTHAIVRNGLEPVFCDVDPETFTMDPDRLEEKLRRKPARFCRCMFMGTSAIRRRLKESPGNMD